MKKKDTHAFVNQLLVYTLVMFFFSGSIGLGTVWMRHQISLTANAAKVLDGKVTEMERLINETHAAIERAQDPAMLKLLNDQWRLGLVPPVPQQTAYIDEDPVMRLAAKHNRGLFSDAPISTVSFQVALQR
ncbi:MAG: hypothetical protein K9M98_06670 [Cephaloticoccus sp.]|nr:hypothetical protein [Cephaloticoccus sp.]MCF7760171.1 hypothetical protein [Cephaloticoccus sp.]